MSTTKHKETTNKQTQGNAKNAVNAVYIMLLTRRTIMIQMQFQTAMCFYRSKQQFKIPSRRWSKSAYIQLQQGLQGCHQTRCQWSTVWRGFGGYKRFNNLIISNRELFIVINFANILLLFVWHSNWLRQYLTLIRMT